MEYRFHYRVMEGSLIVPNLSQLTLMHVFETDFVNTHKILPLHLRLGFLIGLFSSNVPSEALYASLSSPIRATRLAYRDVRTYRIYLIT
jgi:hypothetical protein